jgi:hypothetical protein
VPVEHADVVLANLAANARDSQGEKTKPKPLYQSLSWRLTKPIRALSIWANFPNEKIHLRMRRMLNYLADKNIDAVDDIAIRNSRSWEITEPLRRVACYFIGLVRKH